jgi:hypothetical protein
LFIFYWLMPRPQGHGKRTSNARYQNLERPKKTGQAAARVPTIHTPARKKKEVLGAEAVPREFSRSSRGK